MGVSRHTSPPRRLAKKQVALYTHKKKGKADWKHEIVTARWAMDVTHIDPWLTFWGVEEKKEEKEEKQSSRRFTEDSSWSLPPNQKKWKSSEWWSSGSSQIQSHWYQDAWEVKETEQEPASSSLAICDIEPTAKTQRRWRDERRRKMVYKMRYWTDDEKVDSRDCLSRSSKKVCLIQ